MPLPRKTRWRPRSRRPGFTMLVAMILLTVITGLSVAWARRVILQQRQVSQRLQATQSEWIASSAIQRALSQLAADSSFNQETWSLSPADLQSKYGANVEIRVSPSESGAARQI
jgi:Tfp pilus assembly protein PilX